MFQFPRFPLNTYGFSDQLFEYPRITACLRLPEAYRSLATFFIGSYRQDIHRAPLVS